LEYYDVPDDCPLVADDAPQERKEAEAAAPPSDLEEAASGILTKEQIREIIRTEIPRENPAQSQQDYMRPAAAGGLSYVMAEAVKGDSGTARAAVLTAASLLGGLIGHEASDHWAGALAGAALIGGLGWQAMRSVAAAADAGSEADAPETHAGMTAAEESGKNFHIPDAHAGTHGQPIRAVGT
jgi:hypothetical protein